jgi:hypothetical protein
MHVPLLLTLTVKMLFPGQSALHRVNRHPQTLPEIGAVINGAKVIE